MDGRKFMLVYNDTKISKKGPQLADRRNEIFFKGYSKWAIWAKMQMGRFAKFSKWAAFLAELRKARKYQILVGF